MVRVYTWLPPAPIAVLDREVAPDLGHSAIEIVSNGDPWLYASYWPDQEGIVGKMTDFLKHRRLRQPVSYAVEIDETRHFMQRPADFVDEVDGLDETRIASVWRRLRSTPYDLRRWNCSTVAKRLLLTAMAEDVRRVVEKASTCGDAGPGDPPRNALEGFFQWMCSIVSPSVIACTPEDVRRIAWAYQELARQRAAGSKELAPKTV